MPAKYRKLVYVAAIAAAVIAFGAGIVTPEQMNAGVDTASQVVALLASILALLNLSPDGVDPAERTDPFV